MPVPLREVACWMVLALMSARLLTSPDQLSSQQLLMAAGYVTGLLSAGWLLWSALALYFIPYNRVQVSGLTPLERVARSQVCGAG